MEPFEPYEPSNVSFRQTHPSVPGSHSMERRSRHTHTMMDLTSFKPSMTAARIKPLNTTHRKLKYAGNTRVAQWLDGQTERIHAKLHLNKLQQEQRLLLKEASLDKLQGSGVVEPSITKRQRRK